MVKFGGSEFVNCSVPLAFGGRYFILKSGPPNTLLSVVLEYQGQLVSEVLKNEPQENPVSKVSKSGAGIVTVVDRKTDRFLYKVRPDSETSVVFAPRLCQEEVSVSVTDSEIKVGTSTVKNCRFNGVDAGVVVNEDGSWGLGCPIPDKLRKALISGCFA